MAAMTESKLLSIIKKRGFSVSRTSKGHFRLIDPNGKFTGVFFAVGHGSNDGMVNAPYVKRILEAIMEWGPNEQDSN